MLDLRAKSPGMQRISLVGRVIQSHLVCVRCKPAIVLSMSVSTRISHVRRDLNCDLVLPELHLDDLT
jgi:hypothetical protein